MKKLKYIIVALLLFAQGTTYAVGLDYGMEFGLSGSMFRIKDHKSALQNELGWGVGTFLKTDFGIVSVGPEFWYTRNTATLDKGHYGTDGKVISNSLDLPIVVSYKLFKVLQFDAGPSFSLFNNAKVDVRDVKESIGRIKPSVGYILGAKVTIFKILMVGARFNGQFTRMDSDLGRIGTNSYTISVGAKF